MNPEPLIQIVQDLNAGRSFREIFNSIYSRMSGLMPCNRLAVALYDASGDVLTIHACRSDRPMLLKEGFSAPLRGSSLESILRTGEPRIIGDLPAYLKANPRSETTRVIVSEGMLSSLSVPLIARGNPFGVLFFSSTSLNAFTADHASFTRLLASHISVALERSLLIEEVRSSKEYMENILENSADAIVIIDMDDRIRSWNRGAERIFGYSAAEIVGKGFDVLLPEDMKAKGELDTIRRTVEREGFITGLETTRIDRDGRRLTLQVSSSAIRDRTGKIIGRSAILRDVTREKHLQADLIRTQSLAAVGELAATVAHEIKNPLAGISGAIQVIADAIPPGDHRREIVPEILAQVSRLDDTVRDLLIFARPWTPELQPTDFVDVVDRVVRIVERQDKAVGVKIRRELPATLTLAADPRLLQEVLFNILQNAVDAMPRGGTIRMVMSEPAGEVLLRIIDTGIGIAPEHQARLFAPFFTTKTRGTGLGLAISKRMVEAHGGRLEIDSRHGKGTEVRISLPRQVPVMPGPGSRPPRGPVQLRAPEIPRT